MSNAPDTIYFQIDEDWTLECGHHPFRDATWSVERINDSDIRYARAIDWGELHAMLPSNEYSCPFHGAVMIVDCSFCQDAIASLLQIGTVQTVIGHKKDGK